MTEGNLRFLALLLPGCSRQIVVPDEGCDVVETPLADAAWTGPSEEELLATIAGLVPTMVTWDEHTLGAAESTIAFAVQGTLDVPHVEERSRGGSEGDGDAWCRVGPELVLPVAFGVDIDSGAVQGVVPGTLAVAATGEEIYVYGLGPIALYDAWAELATAALAEQYPRATPEWSLDVTEVWSAGQIEVASEPGGTLWRGHWTIP